MGNEENSTSLQRKIPNAISEEDEPPEDKEKKNFRCSSVKMKSFHLNKEQYHGQALGEIKDGYGICYYENGDKYDGNWKDNKKEGKGSFFYNEKGEIYKGNFCNDLPNGMGIYYFKNGDRYEGMFKDGKMHGEGTIICKYDSMEASVIYSKISNSHLPTEIQGEEGTMIIGQVNTMESVKIIYRDGSIEDLTQYQEQHNMCYEIEEFTNIIEKGEKESKINSLEFSKNVMEIMDEARRQIKLVYPADIS